MADAPNVIRWEGDIAPLKAAYDELNAKEKKRQELVTTGGKTLAKAWEQQQKAAERAAKGPSEWTLALKANTAAVTEARGSINKAREATGAFAAALSLLSPEAAAAAQGLQKAEGAAAGLAATGELAGVSVGAITAGLGAAAVAAVPAYLAFRQSAADLEEMDRWVKITAEDLKDLQAGTETIVEAQFELDRRAQKLRGAMTEQEAATYAAAEAQGVYKGASDALSGSLDNQTRRLEEMRRRLSDKTMLETLGDWFNPFSAGAAERLKAIDQQADEVERLKRNVEDLDEAEGEYAGTLKGVIIQEERRGAGKKAAADAIRDQEKAARDAEAALQAEIAALLAAEKAEQAHYAAIRKGVKALEDQEAAAKKASLSAVAQVEVERVAANTTADSIARIALMEARTADERRDIEIALAESRVAINQGAADKITKLLQEEMKEANDLLISKAEKTVAAVGSLFGSIGDVYDTLMENGKEAADNGTKAEQDAYIKQWYASQALKEAEVAANTIVGVSVAAASLPPPLNAIPIAAALATGVAQEVAIAAVPPPTFEDTPGPVVAPHQNYQPTFKNKDIIIAAQTPQEVQRQAASLGDGGRWSRPSTAKQLAQTNVGWMLGQQLRLTVRGQQDRG